MNEVHSDIEKAIDYVFFENKFVLNLYDYMKVKEFKKNDILELMSSVTVKNIKTLISELEEYLEGGQDSNHRQLREAYGHIPKPNARKISKYLGKMIEDTERLLNEKQSRGKKKQHKQGYRAYAQTSKKGGIRKI